MKIFLPIRCVVCLLITFWGVNEFFSLLTNKAIAMTEKKKWI